LEKNFDSVGKGYEKALLAFDKLEEEKQTLNQVKEALLKQVQDLQQVNSQLQAELQQTKTSKQETTSETTLR
jgi:predicted  nucleic acid-binding Zn-ribbon protein